MLVRFVADRRKQRPTDLALEDFEPDVIMAFLEHAESEQDNSARTRNARLAAIRAFFRYVEYRVPACLDLALRVRAVPAKRTDITLIDYLTREEIGALPRRPRSANPVGNPRSRHAASRLCRWLESCGIAVPPAAGSAGAISLDDPHHGQGTSRARAAALARDSDGRSTLPRDQATMPGDRAVPERQR